MQKFLLSISCLVLLNNLLPAQKVSGKLQFEQGKTLVVNMVVTNKLAQQAGPQAIDFTINGSAFHTYKVTNATEDNTTLHHAITRLSFDFDGMGQKKAFDSDKDLNKKKGGDGQFEKPVREILAKNYDIIIDSSGKTLLCKPEKIELSKTDDRARIVTDLLRDLTAIVYPPQKGDPSFFKILPDQEVGVADTWTTSRNTETEKSTTAYTLSTINDSVIIVNFKTTATLLLKSEIMGTAATTNMTSIETGNITLDKVSGIIKEKTSLIESTGTTEVMGTSMPLSSKTTIRITVQQAP